MTMKKWTENIISYIGTKKESGYSYDEISELLEKDCDLISSPGAIRKAYCRYGKKVQDVVGHVLDPDVDDENKGPVESTSGDKKNREALINELNLIREALVKKKFAPPTRQPIQSVEIPIPTPMKIKYIHRKRDAEEEAVLLISDNHIGALTPKVNKSIFPDLVQTIVENVMTVASYLSGYSIKKLHVHFLGDIITGESIYRSQPYEIDLSTYEQWKTAVELWSRGLQLLAQHFERVEVACVYGNHGKFSKDAAALTNADLFTYKALQLSLASVKNIKFTVFEDWYGSVRILGHDFLLMHGDAISGAGDSDAAIVKAANNWQQSLGKFDVLEMGHFHSGRNLFKNGIRYMINGCLIEDDPFSLKVVKQRPAVMQWFYGVSKKRAITWRYEIDTRKEY